MRALKSTERTHMLTDASQGMHFPGSSVVKNLPAKAENVVSIPGSGRSFGEANGNPLQCSCLGKPKDRGDWWATVHGIPWTEYPGRLQSMGSQRARHILATEHTHTRMHPSQQGKCRHKTDDKTPIPGSLIFLLHQYLASTSSTYTVSVIIFQRPHTTVQRGKS